ncbi:DUF1272 domain-containing protein [Alteromonas sp. H39]|uniref:DUF1272 domain-containing protein n=1 Tax=Alteromonas sp. H39 TaxID=3389876 RepID=UPI0039DFA1BE
MAECKTLCEWCNHPFGQHVARYSCQHNCTFCEVCTTARLRFQCPNCQGVLRCVQPGNENPKA